MIRIAALAGCIALLVLGLAVVIPRIANERGAATRQPVDAQAAAASPIGAHAGHAAEVDVDGLLATDTPGVRFCASASLQPYAGALQQIEDAGPGEAATRFSTCLLETIFYHAPDPSVAQLNTHLDHFATCFGALVAARVPDPTQAADHVTACVTAGGH